MPTDETDDLEDITDGRCGATTRDGTPCRKWPASGAGEGRCRFHGGASTGPTDTSQLEDNDYAEGVGPTELEHAYANYEFRVDPVAETFDMETLQSRRRCRLPGNLLEGEGVIEDISHYSGITQYRRTLYYTGPLPTQNLPEAVC